MREPIDPSATRDPVADELAFLERLAEKLLLNGIPFAELRDALTRAEAKVTRHLASRATPGRAG